MQIGILETGRPSKELAARYGTAPQMLAAYLGPATSATFTTYSIFEGAPVPGVATCDAWIITGSPYAVYENHPWLPPARVFIHDAITGKKPLLGICFGHQLMAQAMGGHVEKSSKGWGTGIQPYTLTGAGEKLLPGPRNFMLPSMHQDQVVNEPPNGTLLANSPFCAYAAYSYGDYGLSFQAHPEYTVAYERDSINSLKQKGIMPEAVADAGLASLETHQSESTRLLPMLKAFLIRQ